MELEEPLFQTMGFDFTFAETINDLTITAVDFYQVFLPLFALVAGAYIAKMLLGFLVVPVRVALGTKFNNMFAQKRTSTPEKASSTQHANTAGGFKPSWERGKNRYETRN